MNWKRAVLGVAAVSLVLAASAFGQKDAPPAQEGGRPQPPLEAFAACKNKQEGDKAELPGPQGQKITGTCVKHGEQLVLRPDHPPKEGGGAGGPKRQQGQ